MERLPVVYCKIGKKHVGVSLCIQPNLQLLRSILEAMQRLRIRCQVHAVILPQLFDEIADEAVVEILAAKPVIPAYRFDVENPLSHI